jgi:hypothetical protein
MYGRAPVNKTGMQSYQILTVYDITQMPFNIILLFIKRLRAGASGSCFSISSSPDFWTQPDLRFFGAQLVITFVRQNQINHI